MGSGAHASGDVFPAALSEYDVDVILPDASVLLTLSSSDATMEGNGALTWRAQEPPWRAGDELMLRVRRPGSRSPRPRSAALGSPRAQPNRRRRNIRPPRLPGQGRGDPAVGTRRRRPHIGGKRPRTVIPA